MIDKHKVSIIPVQDTKVNEHTELKLPPYSSIKKTGLLALHSATPPHMAV